ncbi:MAG: PAS domain S-box protein [bacterium]
MKTGLLLVHSDSDFTRHMQKYLSRHGYEVEIAATGNECLEKLASHKSAPKIAAVELELQQRHNNKLPLSQEIFERYHLPVIFITRRQDPQVIEELTNKGAYGLLDQSVAASPSGISGIASALRLYRSEHRHKSSEEKYRFFFNNIPIAAVVSDKKYTVQEWNFSAQDLFGYRRKEAIGQNLIQLLSSEKNDKQPDELMSFLLTSLENQKKSHNYNYDRTKDGRDILCEWYDLPYRHNGKSYILSVAKDITEEKQLLDELRDTVIEKEFLLRETNHRVKNSLNMINSLINLKTANIEAQSAFADLKGKIQALSSLYEKLHQNSDATEIDLQQYVEELLNSLFSTFADYPIDLQADLHGISIDPDTAISIGLIINEIATNAIKHGFKPEEDSWFRVRLDTTNQGSLLLLSVSNSGHPLPRDIAIGSTDTLGMRLIQTLVEQLQGSLELTREPQPVYTIRFPRKT